MTIPSTLPHRLLAASLALLAPVPSSAAPLDAAGRAALLSEVATLGPQMDRAALDIWRFAELGFAEKRSSALLQAQLRAAGFTVEAGVAGMPTAFVARYKSGSGPVIGVLAEFDALPGLSQAAEPVRKPVPGQQAGHACGHNLLGAASVAAAIAVRRWMAANNVAGEIRVYGAPAEEGGSGKVFLVRAGLMQDVGAMLHWHPADRNSASQGRTLANISGKFRFTGIASHASIAPHAGRSALDGVEAMDMMVNQLREHVPQESRIHYIISNGGSAPNVVPETAEAYYYVRHPDQKTLRGIFARVTDAAKGAALGTGTTMEFNQTGGTFDLLPNDVLGRRMYANLQQVGGVAYTPKEQAFAGGLSAGLHADGPDPGSSEPYEVGRPGMASTDVGDVSYVVPTAGVSTASWAAGTPAHSWQAVAASGASIGLKGAAVAAATLALTAADLLRSPEVLEAARAELEKRRGVGFTYTSLLGDQPPSLHYREADRSAGEATKNRSAADR